MLCIGGPLHGRDIEFDKLDYFYASILEDRTFRQCADIPDYKLPRKAVYHREKLVTRTHKIIECWIVE